MPYLNSNYYYTLSNAKFYCAYPFDREQILTTMIATSHAIVCVGVISYCYIQIYRFYTQLKPKANRNSTLDSTVSVPNTATDIEYRILLITILLVGWTFIGNR